MSLRSLMLATIVAPLAAAAQTPRDTLQLDEAVVTGTRSATTARNLPFTVSVVSHERLTANQRLNVLPTLTEQVPGLFVTQRGMLGYGVSGGAAGGISVRGMGSGTGQLLVLIDGHPQYQGVYGHSIADSYQTMMAERVEVLRGPASVLYGSNAMGGVINIVTHDSKEDGVRTHVNLGAGSWATLQGQVSNHVRKGRFSSTVAANYSRSNNHRPDMGFEQFGGYVRLGYELNDAWRAFADADVTHFNASQPGSTTAPLIDADQWITRGVATLAVENRYKKANGRISIYDNFGRHKIDDGYAEGAKPQTEYFRSKDALCGASAYETLELFKGNSITIGMDYQHILGHAYYTDKQTGEVVTAGKRGMQSADEQCDEVAGYVDIRQDFTRWLTLDAGVRYDYHTVAGGEWVPQAGLVIRPMAGGEVKATVGKGFRNPSVKDMYLYAVANDELRAERLWNYELAWRHRVAGGRFNYGVNLFMLNADNLIQTAPVDGKTKNMNVGEVNNKGVELDAAWRVNSHWTLTTNHSYLYMKHHVLATPEYKGYFGADMRYGKWTASAGLQQVCGLYTAVNAKAPENDKQETFSLLNATVGYQVLRQLQLWVKGDNLLAQKYEINAGYPMPRATVMAGVNVSF